MTATETGPPKFKDCERPACGARFEPRPGENGSRWLRRRYCSSPCASAARRDPMRDAHKRSGTTASKDVPECPVPPGQTWRPVGFPAVPDHRPR